MKYTWHTLTISMDTYREMGIKTWKTPGHCVSGGEHAGSGPGLSVHVPSDMPQGAGAALCLPELKRVGLESELGGC